MSYVHYKTFCRGFKFVNDIAIIDMMKKILKE
jgi:hypothetical protein